ncbi:hypothetical protein [Eggerthella timonensis]|uniref:hypothetical protein n=1 Tax=Eggerthella timonensis TaxID=1871008 RepID=UPI0011AFA5F3|nr:hypothetical protein [Eggerthella timonensis]
MSAKWKLYYVESDGYEDCFVVAKNKRSAIRVDRDMNDFETKDLKATLICDIPDNLEEVADARFLEWSRKNAPSQVSKIESGKLHAWPYYPDQWLLKELGASFRVAEGAEEILLDGVVYSCDSSGLHHTRTIGVRALWKFNPDLPKVVPIDEETADIKTIIYQMLGMALRESQEIEWFLNHSFVFAFSDKQRRKIETINEAIEYWSHKTLGAMVNIMKESFEFSEDVDNGFKLFIDMRNRLVHDILMSERYSIDTNWGQRELIAYLDLFLTLCEPIKEIATACCDVSFALGEDLFGDSIPNWERNPNLTGLFSASFTMKLH